MQTAASEKTRELPNPLGTDPIPRLIVRYSIPTALTLMVNFLYNIVDQIFVGQGVGISGMAATNVAFPLTIVCAALALLLGDGCSAQISLSLGAGQQETAEKALGHTLPLLLGSGVLLGLLSFVFAPGIVLLCGATETVYADSLAYLRTIAIGIPFQMICPALTAIIRMDGAPKYGMKCMIAGALINLVLDPIFIFPLGMGVVGAGIATVIGQAVAALFCLAYLKRLKTIRLRRDALRPTWELSRHILSLGFPSLVTQLMFALVQITMNNQMRSAGALSVYGSDIALSVYGMMMKVYQICHSMLVGVSSATQPINGFNFGARQYGRVRQTYRLAAAIALLISALWFLIFQLLPRQIGMLFVSGDSLYLDCAARCFRLYMLTFFLYGLHMTTASFFQGIGKPGKALLLPLTRQGVFLIPLALALSRRFGLDGALLAAPVADVLAFLLSAVLARAEFANWKRQGWCE